MSRNQTLRMDVAYPATDIGFDEPFRAVVAFACTGWNVKFGNLPRRLWTGVMHGGTTTIGNHFGEYVSTWPTFASLLSDSHSASENVL
jgi:hypothetical protein